MGAQLCLTLRSIYNVCISILVVCMYNVCISSMHVCIIYVLVYGCSVVSDSATPWLLWPCLLSPGSSVHGIILTRTLEWSGLPFPFLGDLSHSGIQPKSAASALAGGFFYHWTTWEAQYVYYVYTNTHTGFFHQRSSFLTAIFEVGLTVFMLREGTTWGSERWSDPRSQSQQWWESKFQVSISFFLFCKSLVLSTKPSCLKPSIVIHSIGPW